MDNLKKHVVVVQTGGACASLATALVVALNLLPRAMRAVISMRSEHPLFAVGILAGACVLTMLAPLLAAATFTILWCRFPLFHLTEGDRIAVLRRVFAIGRIRRRRR